MTATPGSDRYTLTVVFEADSDEHAKETENAAMEAFDSVIDQCLERDDGKRL